ncbi:MAG: TRAP transporter TatT component family protein [Pseudomonadales bacterium]|nr:TRAP transporter TatT component family protein [Pseudomonadales bacterium]
MKKIFVVFILLGSLSGCASLVSGITSRMADNLATTILNSSDIDTVREGVPAYLLLVDSFLRGSPDEINLLLAASSLNGSYSIFTEPDRSKMLNQKALDYAMRAVCLSKAQLCDLQSISFAEFENRIAGLAVQDVRVAYAMGVAWAGWIQAFSDDWNAIGQLGRVKALMEKIVELDETWEGGGPHFYMGGLETLLPASMGGRPEKGKIHFERSLKISDDKYLMTRVIYAEQYARLAFNKELHDRLLQEVIAADPVFDDMTLINKMAQARAAELLAESDEYF